nr:hypothetical protein CFP56_11772 [Quercus suber]
MCLDLPKPAIHGQGQPPVARNAGGAVPNQDRQNVPSPTSSPGFGARHDAANSDVSCLSLAWTSSGLEGPTIGIWPKSLNLVLPPCKPATSPRLVC